MGAAATGGKPLHLEPPVADDDRLAGGQRLDALGGEAEVHQGDAFAGGAEERPFDRVAKGLDPQRVAGHDHVAQGVEKHDAVRPVKLLRQLAKNVDQRRAMIDRHRRADLVHEDFGVGFPREVVVVVAQQLLPQLHVIGQLAVEGETEPFVLLDVVPLEGLGVAAVLGAAGGVADVSNRRPAGVFLHQALVFRPMTHAKDLGDRADFLVGVDQLASQGIVGGHSRGELAAVLDVQEHPRHPAAGAVRAEVRAQGARAPAGKMINRGDAAFVV